MDEVDAVVIGAGVVGLACARALALKGREVMLLEAADAIGTETSSRNSEVIHAGMYYPAGSLKAELCVRGRRQLYAYCAERGVEHRRCGKLIVATQEAQLDALRAIRVKGLANGLAEDELVWLDADAARALEPALNCVAALHSTQTGIVDTHGLMLALQGDMENAGGLLALLSPVARAECRSDGILVVTQDGSQLLARTVVNAAGLHAPDLARRFAGLAPQHVPTAHYCKGNYFTLGGRSPFRHLIYPVPEAAGLGVHLTLDLGGQARFGPDVEWIAGLDEPRALVVDPARGAVFYDAVRRYWPGLADGALAAGYAGIRPKISGPDEVAADFVIQGPSTHGVAGLVNLFGIESPGLTSCLAIADFAVDAVGAPD